MAASTTRKRRALYDHTDDEYDSDEIVVVQYKKRARSSRTPLKTIHNSAVQSSPAPTAPTRRVLDYVHIPVRSFSNGTGNNDVASILRSDHVPLSSPLRKPAVKTPARSRSARFSAPVAPVAAPASPIREPDDYFEQAAPEQAAPEPVLSDQAASEPATSVTLSRPRRSITRRSYVPEPLSDEESDHELVTSRHTTRPQSRAKSRLSTARKALPDADASDFEMSGESAASSTDAGEPTESEDDTSVGAASSDEENVSQRNRKPSRPQKSTQSSSRGANKGGSAKATSKNMTKLHGRGKVSNRLNLDLPPLSSVDEIFQDLTERSLALGLDKVLEHLHGRPLRVATMCSGTESPLLALQKVEDVLKAQSGHTLNVEHVFSAEIEPYKQAYIERNFNPPIIFRDITETMYTDEDIATTAYGGKARIPLTLICSLQAHRV